MGNQDQGSFKAYEGFTRVDLTGTITFTNGANTIVGIGTDFINQLQVGDIVVSETDGFSGCVAQIVSALNVTFFNVYEGAGGAGHDGQRFRVTAGTTLNNWGLPSCRTYVLPALGTAPVQINIEGIHADYGTIVADRGIRMVIVEQGAWDVEAAQALLTNPHTCFSTIAAGSWNSTLEHMLKDLGVNYAIYACADAAVAGTISVIYHTY